MFWKRRKEVATQAASPTPKRRFTDELDEPVSVLAGGITLRGDISGQDSIRISGTVEGDVTVRGFCHVSEGGKVRGRISAHDVIVEGELNGRVSARQRIELRASAHVRADINAESVAMADGAHFDGRIQMRGAGTQTSFQEKRRSANAMPRP